MFSLYVAISRRLLMLYGYITDFLNYPLNVGFSEMSLEDFTIGRKT
jgi:hypothetical protein